MDSITTHPSDATLSENLSLFQQRIWFLQNMATLQSKLNIVATYKVEGDINPSQLQDNLNMLIQAYSTLRLNFVEHDSTVKQQTQNPVTHYEMDVITSDESFAEDSVDLQNLISELKDMDFDLAQGQLFDIFLISFADDIHVLCIVAHRLILDLHSLDWLAQQLLSLQASTDSKTEWGKSVSTQQQLEQVLSQLEDATLVCELPTDFPRPTLQSTISQYHQAVLSDTARDSLTQLAQDHQVSPQTIALSAYIALIYRYTLQDDILMGVLNRPTDNLGAHEDTKVLRHLLEKQLTAKDLIKGIDSVYQSEAGDSSYPPFVEIINALNPDRDLSRSPIVQHGFAHLPSNLSNEDLSIERLYHSAPLIQMDLLLSFEPNQVDYRLTWHYDGSLFIEGTIARFHQHYEQFLNAVAQDERLAIGQVVLTSPEELEEITITWNQTDHTVEDFDFVYRLFEKHAERTPDAIAALEPGKQLTYQELNERSNRLANRLVEYGVEADKVVSIMADRTIDFLVAMLAINKAGGAFLPLSPMYPQKRITQILDKSDSLLVLTGENYVELIQAAINDSHLETKTKLLPLTETIENAKDLSGDNLPPRCDFGDLAYLMFTSGSTGEPKGVMVEHAGMINHNYAKVYDLEMSSIDIMAQTSRQTFDIVVFQFVASLIVGGSVYIMPDDVALDPFRLLEETDKHGITVVQLVPVNIEAILDLAVVMGDDRPKLEKLRFMVPTGDALYTDMCRRWLEVYPHTRMLNTYGATECSDDQCHHVITPDLPDDYRPTIMTIGRPIINTQVYILDSWMQPVPIGVVGELYIGGIGVGRGYLKEPARTDATFVPNPFSDDPDSKLYKSGDQARYLPDGSVEFLGRIGHMIKIRGFRIEPGDIQSVINQHEQVAQSVILTHKFEDIGQQLLAYVVPSSGQTIPENELRTHIRQTLPDYMVPQFIIFLDDIPLNANGKIDRKALPIPDLTDDSREIIAPQNATEEKLLDILKSVLKLDTISTNDSFFDIGGHSLLAMQYFAKIYGEFGQKLPLATIFRSPTVQELASLLENPDELESELKCVVPIQKGDPNRPPLFCIHAHGGHVLVFYNLAKHLGDDQPVYGIQAHGVDGNVKPMETFEAMAKEYIKEIKTVQPTGPYYFLGDCMGGTIGFEVTRQLEEQGEEVELLVMIESFCGGRPPLTVPQVAYELMFTSQRFYYYYLRNLLELPTGKKFAYVGEIFQRAIASFRRRIWSRVVSEREDADPLMITQAALYHAEHRYDPTTIETPITLLSSRLPWGVEKDDTLGWSTHTNGGVEVHKFDDIFYGTLLEDSTEVVDAAKVLRTIVDEHAKA